MYQLFGKEIENPNKVIKKLLTDPKLAEFRKQIEKKYNNCKDYLDSDYIEQFLVSSDTFSTRLFELCVANILFNNDQIAINKTKNKEGGPDFKFCLNDRTFIIECVCPQHGRLPDVCEFT